MVMALQVLYMYSHMNMVEFDDVSEQADCAPLACALEQHCHLVRPLWSLSEEIHVGYS